MIRLSIYKNGNDLLNGLASFWRNISEHLAHGDGDIHCLLAEWGARVEIIDDRSFVCFEDKRMVTLFLLRWA